MSESPQKAAPKIIKRARRRVAPKSKTPAPPEFPDPELPDLIAVNREKAARARDAASIGHPHKQRGKGKRPIVPWPKFQTKAQSAFYEAMVNEACIALSELTRSIAETPTPDPLAGIKASALAMKVTPLVAAWGRLTDTIHVVGDVGPDWNTAMVRKAAMETLMLLVIARDD